MCWIRLFSYLLTWLVGCHGSYHVNCAHCMTVTWIWWNWELSGWLVIHNPHPSRSPSYQYFIYSSQPHIWKHPLTVDCWHSLEHGHHVIIAINCTLFRIYGVTFEVSSCTKFQIFPCWGSLQRFPRTPSWWGGGSLPPLREPHRSFAPDSVIDSHPSCSYRQNPAYGRKHNLDDCLNGVACIGVPLLGIMFFAVYFLCHCVNGGHCSCLAPISKIMLFWFLLC